MQPEYTPEVRFFDSNYRRPCDVAWSDPWGQEHWQEYILCVIWKDQTIEVRSTDKNIYSVSVGKIRLLRSGALTGIHTPCHLKRSDPWGQEHWQEYILCVIWKDQTLEVRSTDRNTYSVSFGKIRRLKSGVLTRIRALCHLERSDSWGQEYSQQW